MSQIQGLWPEEHLRKPWELAHPPEIKTQLHTIFEPEDCTSKQRYTVRCKRHHRTGSCDLFWDYQLVCSMKSRLADAGRRLLFSWVDIPADVVVQAMPNAGEEARGQRRLFMLNFSLSRHKTWVLFHIDIHRCCCSLACRCRPPRVSLKSPFLAWLVLYLLPHCQGRTGWLTGSNQTCCSRLASPGLEELEFCSSLVLGITSYHLLYCQNTKLFLGIQWSVDLKMFLNTFGLSDKSSKD